ncbi:MAG: DUF4921 family protein [Actinomycetota bacterium]|nr:DUF4921 family protein [Actinomycetota bacterium]
MVVHAARHVRSIGELEPAELRLVAAAWRERAAAARAAGFPHVQALVNEGRAAGASRPHSHSQLAWLRERPPAVADEDRRAGEHCRVCAFLPAELDDGTRVVALDDDLAVLAAYAGRLPYELLVVPREHPAESAFDSGLLAAAVVRLGEAVRALHAVEAGVPLNAWLHDGVHWHLELLPRLSVLAGLELGAGIYVNAVPPEEAAARLRERMG